MTTKHKAKTEPNGSPATKVRRHRRAALPAGRTALAPPIKMAAETERLTREVFGDGVFDGVGLRPDPSTGPLSASYYDARAALIRIVLDMGLPATRLLLVEIEQALLKAAG